VEAAPGLSNCENKVPGVPLGVHDGLPVAVAVAVAVGVFVGVGVPAAAHVIESILTPVDATLLSLAILHLRLTIWPLAAAGKVTVEVMYPAELPVQAMRPAIGLLQQVLMVAL